MRRLLPWVAVVWGSFSLLLFVAHVFAFPGDGYYEGGRFLGFAFAIALVVTGMKEISSQHLRKSRALPWLMGILGVMIAIVVAIPFVLPRHYPASLQARLVNSCEAHGGGASYCGCVLSWFESNRSLAQFMAEFGYESDGNATAIDASRSDMTEASASCESQK